MCKNCGIYLGGGECHNDCHVIQCIEALSNQRKLEQEPILDKIKSEFISLYPKNYLGEPELGGLSCIFSLNEVLTIIDKYKTESEE